MGIFRDLAEATGFALPSDLKDCGKTGVRCIDRYIFESVNAEVNLQRSREAFEAAERKRRGRE